MKKILLITVLLIVTVIAQAQKQDTVVVNLGNSSKIIFTMGDPKDIEVLKHYNFDQLFSDIFKKLEEKDKGRLAGSDSTSDSTVVEVKTEVTKNDSDDDSETRSEEYKNDDDDDNDDDNDEYHEWHNHSHRGRSNDWQTFNFDLGTNNYLSDGKFPDDSKNYAVRPWGSWYVGLSSIQKARLARKFFLEWGLGVSWYNFKFEKDNIHMSKDDNGVLFSEDMRDLDFTKSKLTASYVMTSLVPVIDFNDNGRKARIWEGDKDSFRIGIGPYAAYRIGSHSKLVHKDDDKIKEKDYDSFYLNNFRYGLRMQVGYRSTDLFINYDLNSLFVEGKGPDLNAISFGIVF